MNVDVVIVTFNRLEKLKKTLSLYEAQTKMFRNLIVVDNHSTDGTFEYLEEWKKKVTLFGKHIIHTDENLGGSGGFFIGEKYAIALKPDWIFVADDDAYPEKDMMEKFGEFVAGHDVSKYSAICAAVHSTDGRIFLNHRSYCKCENLIRLRKSISTLEDYSKEFFNIDILSYVGPFLNVKALKKVGLIEPAYFIFYDDAEHSLRLSKWGSIICVPSIIIQHDTGMAEAKENVNVSQSISWHDYYFRRNEVAMKIKHFPLVALNQLRHQLKVMLRKPSNEEEELVTQALKDAWLRRMGKHLVYKPGWAPKQKFKFK